MQKTISIICAVILIGVLGFIALRERPTPEDAVVTPQTQEAPLAPLDMMSLDGIYTVDMAQSTVSWEGRGIGKKHTGTVPVEGGFRIENGVITDSDSENTLTFDLAQMVSTDSSGANNKLIEHLKSADFFQTDIYPVAKFILTSLTGNSVTGEIPTNSLVRGNLVIKNIEVPIEFSAGVTTTHLGALSESMRLRGSLIIDRTNWDITFNSNSFGEDFADAAIADEVIITFDILARVDPMVSDTVEPI